MLQWRWRRWSPSSSLCISSSSSSFSSQTSPPSSSRSSSSSATMSLKTTQLNLPVFWIESLPFLLSLSLIITSFVTVANGYSSGAPITKNVCTTLIPGHGSRQGGTSPYKIILSDIDGQLGVNLVATSQVTFAGFVVQARDVGGSGNELDTIVHGEFAQSVNTQSRACLGSKMNTWTHVNGQPKTQVNTLWIAPPHYNGTLQFKGTVVQVKQAYWDQITSDPAYFVSGKLVDKKTYLQSLNNKNVAEPSTLMSNDQAMSNDAASSSSSLSSSSLAYHTCTDRMCIGLGESGKCLVEKNCQMLLSVKQDSVGESEFTLSAKPAGNGQSKYYSMAFSDDDRMGDDLVVDCFIDSTGKVSLGVSYNSGKSNEILPNGQNKLLRDTSGRYVDGVLTCKWRMARQLSAGNGKQYDLLLKRYHILLATGELESDNGQKNYHDLRTRSTEPVSLALVGELYGGGKDLTYLVRIHGSLMVIAWLATVSVAIIFARYFKDAWNEHLLCGVKIWFAFHRGLMLLSITLMIIAQLCIFYFVGGYRLGTHQILGSIAFTLALLQPIGALFRPHPDAPNRWLFNWAHWFGGNAGQICAIAAILLASKLKGASLPDSFLFVMMAWILFHVLIHFVLQFHSVCSNNSSTSDIAMQEIQSNGQRLYKDGTMHGTSGGGGSGQTLKTFLLIIYTLGAVSIVTLLVLLIVDPTIVTNRVSFFSSSN